HRRQYSAGPRPKILGCEIGPADFPQILIYILRTDAPPLAIGIEVLEEFLAGQILAAFDDSGQARILDLHLVLLAGFSPEFKINFRPIDLHMAVSQGGKAERLILFRVLLVANADKTHLQELDHGG